LVKSTFIRAQRACPANNSSDKQFDELDKLKDGSDFLLFVFVTWVSGVPMIRLLCFNLIRAYLTSLYLKVCL
jgi:hypothetical protein